MHSKRFAISLLTLPGRTQSPQLVARFISFSTHSVLSHILRVPRFVNSSHNTVGVGFPSCEKFFSALHTLALANSVQKLVTGNKRASSELEFSFVVIHTQSHTHTRLVCLRRFHSCGRWSEVKRCWIGFQFQALAIRNCELKTDEFKWILMQLFRDIIKSRRRVFPANSCTETYIHSGRFFHRHSRMHEEFEFFLLLSRRRTMGIWKMRRYSRRIRWRALLYADCLRRVATLFKFYRRQ